MSLIIPRTSRAASNASDRTLVGPGDWDSDGSSKFNTLVGNSPSTPAKDSNECIKVRNWIPDPYSPFVKRNRTLVLCFDGTGDCFDGDVSGYFVFASFSILNYFLELQCCSVLLDVTER